MLSVNWKDIGMFIAVNALWLTQACATDPHAGDPDKPVVVTSAALAPEGTCDGVFAGSDCGSDGMLYDCELGRPTLSSECELGCLDNGSLGTDVCGNVCSDQPTGARVCSNSIYTCAFGEITDTRVCTFGCTSGAWGADCFAHECIKDTECNKGGDCTVAKCDIDNTWSCSYTRASAGTACGQQPQGHCDADGICLH
jgi:hypothetical protein